MSTFANLSPAAKLCLFLNRFFPKRRIAGRESPEAYVKAQFQWAQRNFRFFKDHVSLEGKKVLDAGCGPGGKTRFYATQGCTEIIGVDIDPARIRLANELPAPQGASSMRFLVGNLAELPFEENQFDLVFLNDVFEHIDRALLSKVLIELKRVIKPDGFICMEFPPWTSFDASHLYDDIHIPWCQLLFTDETLIEVLKHMNAKDPVVGSLSTIEHFLELNRITIPEAEGLFNHLRFRVHVFRFERIKQITLFAWWPWLDARLTRRVVAILGK